MSDYPLDAQKVRDYIGRVIRMIRNDGIRSHLSLRRRTQVMRILWNLPKRVFISKEFEFSIRPIASTKNFLITFTATEVGSNSMPSAPLIGHRIMEALDSDEAKRNLLDSLERMGFRHCVVLRCKELKIRVIDRLYALALWHTNRENMDLRGIHKMRVR